MQVMSTAIFVFLIILSPVYAMAYVGPGLGAGAIGVVLGVLGSVFIALFALFWYPIKRLLKKIKKSTNQDTTDREKE